MAAGVWQKSLKMSPGDSINRFLLRERYEPLDLFEMVKTEIELVGRILSGDDTLIEKPYSAPDKADANWIFLVGSSPPSYKRAQPHYTKFLKFYYR